MEIISPQGYRDARLPVQARVQDLLAQMTVAEKVAQLSAAWLFELSDDVGFSSQKAQARIGNGIGQITSPGGRSSYTPDLLARQVNAVQGYLVENTRLGIPAIVHDECCSGFMARMATVFPQMIGLASTWDPELAEAMTAVVREQMRAVGVRQGLAPILDVNRDPRWGRVEETYGEDPYLAASMGVGYVRGLQGKDLSQGVAATGKHFVTYGMPEGGLNWSPAHVGKRELREVFLFSFEAAVKEAGLASVMNAYHEIDGVPCGASHELLTEILRGEWGFDGITTSDYNTIQMLMDYHHLAESKTQAAKLALEAGLDVELPGTDCYGEPLCQAVESGWLDMETVDEAVRRVLSLKFRLGLFENPYVDPERALQAYNRSEQAALARRIAQKSIVLLKNDAGLLPLRPDIGSIAVIGPNADAIRHMVGDYSYGAFASLIAGGEKEADARFPERFPRGMVSILEGIRRQVSPKTQVFYAPGCGITDPSRAGFEAAVQAAKYADVAVLVMGGKSGLTADCTCGELRDRANLGLPGVQEELVDAVAETGKPVVLLLVDGRPVAIPGLVERLPAILEAWLPGQEGGTAIAEVLFGKANPGGKLPISFPRSASQIPVFYGRKPSGGRSYQFEDYVDMSVKPLFPFGHGLSYTQFEYGDLSINPLQATPDGAVTIQVRIRNTGNREGDEVAQLYLRDMVASITRPVKELKGYRRVRLQPGEACTLRFTIKAGQLAFYNLAMQYVVEPGKFEVMVGSSAEDIRLRGEFEIIGEARPVEGKTFFSLCEVFPEQ